MCLILISWKNDPHYKMLFLANRDEIYSRPSKSAEFWPEYKNLLAGKDLVDGGTWLGITKNGKFAAITNLQPQETRKKDLESRGKIVTGFLCNPYSTEEYHQWIQFTRKRFNPFNLVFGDIDKLRISSNESSEFQKLSPGIHTLGHGPIERSLPKEIVAKRDLNDLFSIITPPSKEKLFELMGNEQTFEERNVKNDPNREELTLENSPIFIRRKEFGTRSTTLVTVDYKDNVSFQERTFKTGSDEFTDKEFFFSL